MKHEDTQMLRQTTDARLKEHLAAYVLVGYTADEHRRVVVAEFGSDPSCADGLQIMAAAAMRWQEGGLNRPVGGDGQSEMART